VTILSKVQVREESEIDELERRQQEALQQQELEMQHAQVASATAEPEVEESEQTFVRQQPKVGRNEPCPCGSGKKYKQCHGKLS